jgi:Tfp pilus assembly protein PilN
MRRPTDGTLRLWMLAAMLGVVVGVGVLLAVGIVVLLDNSRKAVEQRAAQLELSQLLVECTTRPDLREPPITRPKPSDCYVRQQAELSKTLGEPNGPINTVAVAAAACGAANPGDVPATLACTKRAVTR